MAVSLTWSVPSSSPKNFLTVEVFLMLTPEKSFYLSVRPHALQQRTLSSLQKHMPQKSPHLLWTLFVSHTMIDVNRVSIVKYSITMHAHANRQKLLSAIMEVIEPHRKTITIIKVDIVIDGPAWLTALTTRSDAVREKGVLSIAPAMTNR